MAKEINKTKMKEEEAGTEISSKDFLDFYIPEIRKIKIYHSTIDSFTVSIDSFLKIKKVSLSLTIIQREGQTTIDFRKIQNLGMFSDFGSLIFISNDSKITFEFFI